MLEKINRWKIEKVYVTIMLFFGFLMVFLTPPIQVPDEANHLYRIYQISEGHFRAPIKEYVDDYGSKLYFYVEFPRSFCEKLQKIGVGENDLILCKNYFSLNYIKEIFLTPLNDKNTTFWYIPNTGAYNFLLYLPQVIFMLLARLISDSVGAVFYGARIGAMLFTIFCIYLSLRLLPEKKSLILIIAFMPMFLFEVASLSADAIIYSITILSTAYILSLRKNEDPISRREIFFLVLTAISLGLAKSVYGTILFLYLLIPSKRFGSKKNFIFGGMILISIFLISALSWMIFSKQGLPVSFFIGPFEGVNIDEQIKTIINNPYIFADAIYNAIDTQSAFYFKTLIGKLGWLSIPMPDFFYFLYTVLLVISGTIGNLNLKIFQRIFIILASAPTFIVTFLYSYTTWTPVGLNNIDGIQGRYFIPVAFMIFAALSCFKNLHYENIFIYIACFFSATFTTYEIFISFY